MSNDGSSPLEGDTNLIPDANDADFIDNQGNWDGPHDYASVAIPDERETPKWKWQTEERRAYLLKKLREHGHPHRIPKSYREIGEEFDVTHPTIVQDFKILREYIEATSGEDARAHTKLVSQKAVQELMEDGNWYKALKAQLEFNEWLFEVGDLDREPDKKQVQQQIMSASAESVTELDEDEREQFAQMAQMMNERGTGDSSTDDEDVIDVESQEVEDDE